MQVMNLFGLRAKGYLETVVSDLGRCIVVPADQFLPSWRGGLAKGGHGCVESTLDDVQVVLVQVSVDPVLMRQANTLFMPKAEALDSHSNEMMEMEKVENAEEKKQNSGNPHPKMPWLKDAEFWSPEEDDLIVELWKKGLTLEKIGVEVKAKYPKRVGHAVTKRIYHLQGKGRIEKRHLPKVHGDMEVKETEKVETGKKHYALRGPNWTEAEDDELLMAYDAFVLAEGKKYGACKAIVACPQFKGRTLSAVTQRLKRVLKKREKQDLKKTSEEAKGSPERDREVKGALEKDTPHSKDCTCFECRSPEEAKAEAAEVAGDDSGLVSVDPACTVLVAFAGIAKLSEAIEALKLELANLTDFVQANVAVKYRMDGLERNLIRHKHAVGSGEAMPPFEGS
jgi:hypothetical protein